MPSPSNWTGTTIQSPPTEQPLHPFPSTFPVTSTITPAHHVSKTVHTVQDMGVLPLFTGKSNFPPSPWWHSVFCWHIQTSQIISRGRIQGRSWECHSTELNTRLPWFSFWGVVPLTPQIHSFTLAYTGIILPSYLPASFSWVLLAVRFSHHQHNLTTWKR